MTPRFIEGNAVRLLQNGTQYFPALIAAIESATVEIHLETYIFADDAVAKTVVEALVRARQRDVTVRVLVDGFGARHFIDGLGNVLLTAGCEVLVYRPEVPKMRFRRNRLRRLHRKLTVIDGRVAFVGGINIIDDLTLTDPDFPRYDYAVGVEGPVVADIHFAVRHVWRLVRWASLGHRPEAPAYFPLNQKSIGAVHAAFLIRDNLRHRRDIEDAYLAAIGAAQKEVLIACAYFLPGKEFRETLMAAARRGVEVIIVLQSRGDHAVIRHAERMLYRQLLPSGIRIFEYHAGFLHAKVGVADRRWATVGSSNIDPFSLLLAREANLVIDDPGFAEELRGHLYRAVQTRCTQVMPEHLYRYSWWSRLLSIAAYAFVRFALSVSRYGRKDYRE